MPISHYSGLHCVSIYIYFTKFKFECLVSNAPWMLLVSDIRTGLVYFLLFGFWVVFISEHLLERQNRNKMVISGLNNDRLMIVLRRITRFKCVLLPSAHVQCLFTIVLSVVSKSHIHFGLSTILSTVNGTLFKINYLK